MLFAYDILPIIGSIIENPRNGIWKLKDLVFLSNFDFGYFHASQIWSVAVEFQFYFVSPFIIKWMYRSSRPWFPPLLIICLSLLLRTILIFYYWPNAATDSSAFDCEEWWHTTEDCNSYF